MTQQKQFILSLFPDMKKSSYNDVWTVFAHRGLTFFAKRLEVIISSPVREASLHKEHMYGSSLDCNGLQPVQHLLKSLSRESTDLQYCDWLRSRCNDVIHSEQGLYLYEAHGARQIPENSLKI